MRIIRVRGIVLYVPDDGNSSFLFVEPDYSALVHLAEIRTAEQEYERLSDEQVQPKPFPQHDILLHFLDFPFGRYILPFLAATSL
jgi:hypothetical protein